MSVTAVALRADGLFTGVLAPLVLGGDLHPVRPVGKGVARQIAEIAGVFRPADSDLFARVNEARARRVRMLSSCDELPPFEPSEWLMVAALNDLVQCANPHLPGVLSRSRPLQLLAEVDAELEAIAPPSTLREALLRHGTFAAVHQIARIDVTVRWWTGSATFRGEKAPSRLVAWPELRRVRTEEVPVGVEALPITAPPREPYQATYARLLSMSPLSDLATCARDEPPFAWTPSTLSVVATEAGRRVARRVLGGAGARADVALERATKTLQQEGRVEALEVASGFLDARRAHAALSP